MSARPRLAWRDGRREDYPELHQFLCTPPPPPSRLPKRRRPGGLTWEMEVQSGLRNLKLPAARGEMALIGRDEEGIGAVSHVYEVGGPHEFKILGAAVALRLRQPGYHCGDELIAETIGRIAERADSAGIPQVLVWGLVHERNAASQALVARFGFTYMTQDEDYQEWSLKIALPDH